MSVDAWGTLASVVVVVLAFVWVVRPHDGRPLADPYAPPVDPTVLPVGAYWWNIERQGRWSWQWELSCRTSHCSSPGSEPYTYSRPVYVRHGVPTRRLCLWQIRRAIRRDRRQQGYYAYLERGTTAPPVSLRKAGR